VDRRSIPRGAPLILLMMVIGSNCSWLGGIQHGYSGVIAQHGSTGVIALALGKNHTCALTAGGHVNCWGSNSNGQLGDGSTKDSPIPVEVVGLPDGIIAITAGANFTCALTSGGGVKCWGENRDDSNEGMLTDSLRPVDVKELVSGVAAIAAGVAEIGDGHICALTTDGGVKCWGTGLLGDGSGLSGKPPVDVSGLSSGVAALAVGDGHTCALTSGGGVKCWGENFFGQLGDGTREDRIVPVDVSGLGSGVRSISAGANHTCALLSGGGMKCWGDNAWGKLGNGEATERHIPSDVDGLGGAVKAIAAGANHTCALLTDGGVKCWGKIAWDEENDTYSLLPIYVNGLTGGMTALATGSDSDHTCALTSTGVVKCWGDNTFGQLGDGTTTDSFVPVNVKGL
jgi:alpha-tubulin suppressor-like RCC1 family protein